MAVVEALTAFMEDPDALKPNPIHSTSVAQDYGYRAALVGGVTVYGWTVAPVVDVLGNTWLDTGWAELAFKRPVYPGDDLEIRVSDDGQLHVTRDGEPCVTGQVGLGDASWRDELTESGRTAPEPSPDPLPPLNPVTVPVGEDLAARRVPLSEEESIALCRDRQRERMACFYGEKPRVHPSWIAGQPIHWLHHSYAFGPSIHARSRIQHLAPAYAGGDFVVTGRCTRAFEQREHQYIECDTALRDDAGTRYALVRHTSVYQVANKRGR